jgi:hypothetical protein
MTDREPRLDAESRPANDIACALRAATIKGRKIPVRVER